MADELSPEDQGTIMMFTLTGLLALAASLYFVCRWYRKRYSTVPNRTNPSTDTKPGVSRTFSRFSQVDEELTVCMTSEPDDLDSCLLESHRIAPPKDELATKTKKLIMPYDTSRPYLETDM